MTQTSTATAHISIIHPGVPLGQGKLAQEVTAWRHTADIKNSIELHHTLKDLNKDAETIRKHAQAILQGYGSQPTSDAHILLIPSKRKSRLKWVNHAFAEFDAVQFTFPVIRLFWAAADVQAILPVVTHELGHHLRHCFDPQPPRLPLVHHMLHEGIAESLVRDEHGVQAVHYQGNTPTDDKTFIQQIIQKEQSGQPKSEDDNRLLSQFQAREGYYPAAYHAAQQSGLGVRTLLTFSTAQYAQVILNNLPRVP